MLATMVKQVGLGDIAEEESREAEEENTVRLGTPSCCQRLMRVAIYSHQTTVSCCEPKIG